jgi:uncharacterized repeat protein (TIGR03943 family)
MGLKLPYVKNPLVLDWLDVLAVFAWGSLLLNYWLTNKLSLLVHPRYFGVSAVTGLFLLLLGGVTAEKLLRKKRRLPVKHLTFFPPGWMSSLFLATACLGLLISPRPLMGAAAMQQGISDPGVLTRIQPQAFRPFTQPESRSLVDWARTLTVYPEPDAYSGQKAKVEGFVVHSPGLPNDYLTLTRFAIVHCALDAYPVGLPVKLPAPHPAYAPDRWLEVRGEMITETLVGRRQLVIQATAVTEIPEPKNPYAY